MATGYWSIRAGLRRYCRLRREARAHRPWNRSRYSRTSVSSGSKPRRSRSVSPAAGFGRLTRGEKPCGLSCIPPWGGAPDCAVEIQILMCLPGGISRRGYPQRGSRRKPARFPFAGRQGRRHALKTLISIYAEVMAEVCMPGGYLDLGLHSCTEHYVVQVLEHDRASAAGE